MNNIAQKTILLVEDEAVTALRETKQLEQKGYSVIHVLDGELAIETIKSNLVDLILMDIDLGKGMDGTEAAEIILKTHDVPVVFLSSHTEPEIVEKTEKITSYGYVVKNSGITVLDTSIKMAFKLFNEKYLVKEKQKDVAAAIEELEATNEELEATNEELIRTNIMLEDSQKEILISQKALQESEERLKLSMEATSDGLWDWDLQSGSVYWSPRCYSMLGFEPYEFIVTYEIWQSLLHPDDLSLCEPEVLKSLESGLPFLIEFRFKKKDGTWLWILGRGQCVSYDESGKPVRMIGTHADISEIIKLRRDYELLFKGMIDAFALHEMIFDEFGNSLDYRFIEVNPAFEKMTGLKGEDIKGETVLEVLPGTEKHWIETYGKVVTTGEPISFENYSQELNKHFSVTAYRPSENQFACIFVDITDQKNITQKLHEKDIRFRELFENIGSGVAIYNPISDGENFVFTDFNPASEKMDLKKREEVIGAKVTDVFPGVKQFGLFDVFKEVYRTGEPQSHPISLYQDDNLTGWRDNNVFKLPSGEIVAVYDDRTEQKKFEQALRREKEFIDWALNAQQDTFFLFDPHTGKAARWNKAFVETSGYSDEEISELPAPATYYSEEDITRAVSFIDNVKKEGTGSIELELICKDGKTVPTEYLVSALYDDKGNVQYLISIGRDITERKAAEEEIKNHLEEKETLLKEVHHRIKNNLVSIESLFALQAEASKSPEAHSLMLEAISRVAGMRMLYDKMLLSDTYENVRVKKYFEELIDNIINLFPNHKHIEINKIIADFDLKPKILFPLGIIINELISNAMKYAFNNEKPGSLDISLEKNNSIISLIVQDSGMGMPENFSLKKTTGFGLMLVDMLSRQINGTFKIENHSGARCTVAFTL